MGKKIVHVEFPAQDTDRAQKFWEGVGGWSIEDAGHARVDYRMFQEGDQGGAVYETDERPAGPTDLLTGATTSTPTSRRCASSAARPKTSSRSRQSAGSPAARTPKAMPSACSRATSRCSRRSAGSVTGVAVALAVAAGLAGAVQAAVMGELGERVGVFPALAFSGVVAVVIGLRAPARREAELRGLGRRRASAAVAVDRRRAVGADHPRDHGRVAAHRPRGDDRDHHRVQPRRRGADRPLRLVRLRPDRAQLDAMLGLVLLGAGAALLLSMTSDERPAAAQRPTMSSGLTGTRVSSRPVAARSAATTAAVETTVGGSPTPFTP